MNSSDNPFAIESRLHHPGETQSDSSSTRWTTNASGQVDNLISGGFNNEDMINTISGTYMSFSPIAKGGRPKAQTTNTASYPSQQLNSRFEAEPIPDEEKFLSPPTTSAKLPPPLPPPIVHSSDVRPFEEASSNPSVSMQNFSVDARKEADQVDVVKAVSSDYAEDLDGFIIGLSTPARMEAATALHSFKSGGDATNDIGVMIKHTRTSATNPRAASAAKPRTLPKKTKKENTRKEGAGIEQPGRFDILRGRGGFTNHHSGNIKFRSEARALRADYRNANTTRQQKYAYSCELVNRVKAYGGKFLQKGRDDLWYEMDDKAARKKASQVLREEKWE
jgi:hypothetical protein